MLRTFSVGVSAFLLLVGLPCSASAQDSCLPFVGEPCAGDATQYECVQASTSLSTTQGGERVQVLQEFCFKVGSPLFSEIRVEADLGELDIDDLEDADVVGELQFDALLSDFGGDCPLGDEAQLWAPMRVVDVADNEVLLVVTIEEASDPLKDCLMEYDPTDEMHNYGRILEGTLAAREGGGFDLLLELAPLEGFASFPGLSYGDLQATASPVPLYFRPIVADDLFLLPPTGGAMTIVTTLSAENELLETVSREFVEVFEITGDLPAGSFVRGDGNGDGNIDLSDAVSSLNFLFLGGPGPDCFRAADADDNGTLELTDAIRTLNFLFLGGPPPEAPNPECGSDTTADSLTCEAYPRCN